MGRKKFDVNDKLMLQQVVQLYREERRFKAIKEEYEQSKKKLSTSIRNYMYGKGYSSFDFKSRELGDVRVNKIVRKSIKWDVGKLKKRLPPEIIGQIVDKEYQISDMEGLIEYLKSCGVKPKKFKQYLIVSEKVNQQALNQLSELGDISREDIEGCYELVEAEGYLKINVKENEQNSGSEEKE